MNKNVSVSKSSLQTRGKKEQGVNTGDENGSQDLVFHAEWMSK